MKKQRLIKYPYLLIAIIGLAVYAKTISFDLTYVDDQQLIAEGKELSASLSGFLDAFHRDVLNGPAGKGIYYRPILTISFILDAWLGGGSPFINHLTNLILHLVASCLIFFLFTKLGYADEIALVFSVIFTVHPALAQAVAWIPGRNDILLTVFVLLSFIGFLDFLDTKKLKYYLLHIFLFALALFTKESAVFLPIMCLVYLYLIMKEKKFSYRSNILTAGWLIVIGFWLFMRKIGLSNPVEPDLFYISGHFLLNLPALVPFIGKAILPFNLSVWPIMENTSFIYGILSIILIAAAIIFTKRPRYGFIVFGALWFVLFLSPVFIHIRLARETVFLEHRLYLPVIGIMILLYETKFVKRLALTDRGSFIAAISCIAIFSSITFCHSENFKDSLTFCRSAVTSSPDSVIAHMNLGSAYLMDANSRGAVEEFKKAIAIAPHESFGYNYLGVCYMEKNMFKEASLEFRKAMAIDPGSDHIRHNLVDAYFKDGNLGEVERLMGR